MRYPVFVGRLLSLPIEGGQEALVDPKTVIGVTVHRSKPDITVVRTHREVHFVTVDFPTVRAWLGRDKDEKR
jgi:hypothetical protein